VAVGLFSRERVVVVVVVVVFFFFVVFVIITVVDGAAGQVYTSVRAIRIISSI
jgi:hypothetical protein